MDHAEARRRFAGERVAHLATADASGAPHVVPLVFAVQDDVVYSVVDRKPKRSNALRRLANVAENPRVALLADHYDEDWSTLWWVRADGAGRIVDAGDEWRRAVELLTSRYPQYDEEPPTGPVLAVDVLRWSGWSASQ